MNVCECEQQRFCSTVSRALGEDPAGTATPYRGYLLIEMPLPWPRDMTKSPFFPGGLTDLLGVAVTQKVRALFLAPDPDYSRSGHTRVIRLQRPLSGPTTGFMRDEYLVPHDRITALVESLLQATGAERFAPYRVEAEGVRDLLVCTHGSTDAACGRYGYPLYESLRHGYVDPNLRVWRVSHVGGHRFAPTVLDFPEGRFWAHLDPGDADAVVRRVGPVAALRMRYRGWTALDSPFEQVAERAVFEREGWAWVGRPMTSRLEPLEEGRARVEITFEGGGYTIEVEVASTPTTMSTSRGDTMETKQYRITQVQKQRS